MKRSIGVEYTMATKRRKKRAPRKRKSKKNPRLGKCYEVNADALLSMPPEAAEDFVLVHGRPTLTRAPYAVYGHAWLEKWHGTPHAIVYDRVSEIAVPAALYYQAGNIDPTDNMFTYTQTELRKMLMLYGHWGPWEGIEAEGL
ncbi:MAG: hypothetical protein V3T11_10010 [Roseateles sp.]